SCSSPARRSGAGKSVPPHVAGTDQPVTPARANTAQDAAGQSGDASAGAAFAASSASKRGARGGPGTADSWGALAAGRGVLEHQGPISRRLQVSPPPARQSHPLGITLQYAIVSGSGPHPDEHHRTTRRPDRPTTPTGADGPAHRRRGRRGVGRVPAPAVRS